MPREIVHWNVLEETLKQVSDSGLKRVEAVLRAEPEAAYLGALAHDAPYYYRYGGDYFEEVAEFLHGTEGADTFEGIRRLAAFIETKTDQKDKQILWSFLIGMLTHCMADIHFHPVVYYFTGNYYASDPKTRKAARAKHRLFEVYLDSWFRIRVGVPRFLKVSTVIENLGSKLDTIVTCLEEVLVPERLEDLVDPQKEPKRDEELSANRWRESFRLMSWCQERFLSPIWGLAIRIADRITLGKLRPIDNLCSYGRLVAIKFFDSAIELQNPVSGEVSREQVNELRDRAVRDMLTTLRQVEEVLTGNREPRKLFEGEYGLSLNYGLPKVWPADAKFFSPASAFTSS